MWKLLQDSQPPLYLTFEESINFEILVTDYINLWRVNFSKESFLTRLKDCNDDLEFESDNEFVKQGIALLTQPEKIKKLLVEKEDGGKTLSICMHTSFGYPFKFECKLLKTSDEFFCKKVTIPLIKIIKDLRTSQTKLREKIRRKDKVIKAYKDKGVTLTARRLKPDAVEFNDEAHMSRHKEYETIFGANVDPDVLIKLELQSEKLMESTNGTIKIEPGIIKTEPEAQTNEAMSIPNLVSMQIKQEDVKTEPLSSNIVIKKQRRRLNL